MKQLTSAVHNTISNYQLTSRSKRYRRLKPKNERAIVDGLVKKDRAKLFMELIHKRDYYTNKIHEMLNSAGEQLDPSLIDDDADAEHYIAKVFMSSPEKVEQVRSLIGKHIQSQHEWAAQLEGIEKKHEQKSPKYKGLLKFAGMNTESETKRVQQKERELHELYQQVARQQQELAREATGMLRVLEVPFFVGPEPAQEHREHVLDVLYKLVGQ